MQHFGAWVRSQRETRRMTQSECATLAGMKKQNWSRIEKAYFKPQMPTMEAVAAAFSMTITDVAQAAGYVEFDPELSDNRLARRLGILLDRVPAEMRPKLEDKIVQIARIVISDAA